MNKRLGTYITQKIAQEPYQAYLPAMLPPDPPIDVQRLYPALDKATRTLAELNSLANTIPNTALFIYMYVRKEALLSSQIEGTQSSFSDLILFENHQTPSVSLEDVEEVSNYIKAINYGLTRLNNNFPLSLRLLCEIHGVLLQGVRGATKLPGEFRRSQNWIGGTRPGNALFVPPPPERLLDYLSNFEKFLHISPEKMPILIKAGIAHVQFETIHPYLDGNGRLGRLLITLLFCENGLLDEPILYLSLYLKQNRAIYYDLLQEVRQKGTWENWLEFFLEGVTLSAKQAIITTKAINTLFENDFGKIAHLGRARFTCLATFEYLKKLPQITTSVLAKALKISTPTARHSLQHLQTLGIIEEISGKKRDKIYIYRNYLSLLEEGATPFN